MQARGFLNYHLTYYWLKVIYCICQPKELKQEIKKKMGGTNRGPTKNLGGRGPPKPPIRIATDVKSPTATGLTRSNCRKFGFEYVKRANFIRNRRGSGLSKFFYQEKR